MSTKHVTQHPSGAKTMTTRYSDGSRKSVTHAPGSSVFSDGKITKVTHTDRSGNSRTKTY